MNRQALNQIKQLAFEFRLANAGQRALKHICKEYEIASAWSFFSDWNDSKAEYHCKYHAICVTLNVYEGSIYYGLSFKQTRNLLLAAIFHDFDHSGDGRFSDCPLLDEQNIELALIGLNTYLEQVEDEFYLADEDYAEIINTLRITKYPYAKDPVTISEMIIRDADLMQAYELDDARLLKQYRGLQVEIERARSTKFTTAEFAEGQRAWLNENVKWYSQWAIKKAETLDWESTKQRLFDVMNGS